MSILAAMTILRSRKYLHNSKRFRLRNLLSVALMCSTLIFPKFSLANPTTPPKIKSGSIVSSKKQNSVEEIKRQVGPGCPNSVAKLLQSNQTDIPKIKRALTQVKKAAGRGVTGALYLLEDYKIAKQFVENPVSIVRAFKNIKMAARGGEDAVFYALFHEKIRDQFLNDLLNNKRELVKVIRRFSAAVGHSATTAAFEARKFLWKILESLEGL
jgi:hypothetical protein